MKGTVLYATTPVILAGSFPIANRPRSEASGNVVVKQIRSAIPNTISRIPFSILGRLSAYCGSLNFPDVRINLECRLRPTTRWPQSQQKPKPMSQQCGPAKAECEAKKPKHMGGQKLLKKGKFLSFSWQAIPLSHREPFRISNWAVKVYFFVSEPDHQFRHAQIS